MRKVFMTAVLAFVLAGVANSDTWRLDSSGQWDKINKKDGLSLEIAELKQLVFEGKAALAEEKIEQLKQQHPAGFGEDFDEFAKAEILYAKGKFIKAVRQYNKFLDAYPQSEYYPAAIERQFSIANAFLSGQKKRVLKIFKLNAYDEAAGIMESIAVRTGDSPMAQKAMTTLAAGFQNKKKYEEAFFVWNDINAKWPGDDVGKNSLRGMADSLYLDYRGPWFDGAGLNNSKSYYELYEEKFPAAAQSEQVDNRLGQIEQELAYKELKTGDYYRKTKNYKSANLYYRMVIENWPSSPAAELAQRRLAEPVVEPAKKRKSVWDYIPAQKFDKAKNKVIKKIKDLR